MKKFIVPQNYDEWWHCIVVKCELELTPDFISERISLLQNERDHYTQQFIKLYGQQYLQKVLGWFIQAKKAA